MLTVIQGDNDRLINKIFDKFNQPRQSDLHAVQQPMESITGTSNLNGDMVGLLDGYYIFDIYIDCLKHEYIPG